MAALFWPITLSAAEKMHYPTTASLSYGILQYKSTGTVNETGKNFRLLSVGLHLFSSHRNSLVLSFQRAEDTQFLRSRYQKVGIQSRWYLYPAYPLEDQVLGVLWRYRFNFTPYFGAGMGFGRILLLVFGTSESGQGVPLYDSSPEFVSAEFALGAKIRIYGPLDLDFNTALERTQGLSPVINYAGWIKTGSMGVSWQF